MWIPVFLVVIASIITTNGYVIGGGTQPGGNQYNPSNNNNGGIGGGVYPGGGGGNNGGGGVQRDEGGYCNSNYDCRSGLYCTSSVNSVKICLSTSNGDGGSGFPTANSQCTTSANCQNGGVCVVRNGVGSCQIQAGGYVSPARQDFNEDVFSKNAPEPGKMNSACERDADCDDDLSCTLYFGEMMCRAPIKPLVPLRCESDAECPSTEYLCVFSTAMQDRVCYKYGDVVTDGYVIPIKHKISMELKTSSTPEPLAPPKEETGLFAESHAIFSPDDDSGSHRLLTSALQKRANEKYNDRPGAGFSAPIYMKMEDPGATEDRTSFQHDGEAVRMTKVVVKEEDGGTRIGQGAGLERLGIGQGAVLEGPRIGQSAEIEKPRIGQGARLEGQAAELTRPGIGQGAELERPKIGQGAQLVDDEPIDPMATVCQYDYHCRMGESCSGRVRFVDRNITVCRYDILKKNKQCIYHSDCLSGQRCTAKSKDLATCETDISATIGSIQCFYDYDCSGGEKCTLVDEKERKFVCRPSPTSDPRMNQICTTNAQCPFQQVCRQSAGISLCVDVSISKNPAMLHERLWRFLRNFIFHRRR